MRTRSMQIFAHSTFTAAAADDDNDVEACNTFIEFQSDHRTTFLPIENNSFNCWERQRALKGNDCMGGRRRTQKEKKSGKANFFAGKEFYVPKEL